MFYAIYQGIRDSAWRCLSYFEVQSLPVDVLKIARASDIHVIKNSLIHDLLPGEYGKSYFNGHKWIIIYDDRQPTPVARFTLAHELGHIFLGHNIAYIKYHSIQEFQNKGKSEQQADAFAVRLLCPACILWGLGLHRADEIAQYCRVPEDVAREREARMKILYERNRFLTTELEQKIYKNFSPYIQRTLECKRTVLSDGMKFL